MAATGRPGGPWLIVAAAVVAGLLIFAWLSVRRGQARDASTVQSSAVNSRQPVTAALPPPDLALEEAAARGGVASTAQLMLAPPTAVIPPPPALTTETVRNTEAAGVQSQRLRAPALVVDFADAQGPPAATATTAGGAAGGAGKAGSAALSGDEQFADRVGGAEPERAQATELRNRPTLIAQGVTITGVLETALDSDLPGFARAVVSRDVRGFDGSQVLIPRGSRVIGQYKSAVAQGQKRAFVIWTRIIRPDGVSIQIGSSGTDPLGRAGLAGKVDTHFLERFSGAILLSVISAGVNSIGRPSTQVVIGSGADAATASLSALIPTAIPPTIKVAQGTAIRIFVARDLDFSPVQGIGR